MKILIKRYGENNSLSEIIKKHDIALDVRCNGNGTCGRCRVLLCNGSFECNGEIINDFPREVLACKTKLLTDCGEVEIPETSLVKSKGQVADSWVGKPLKKIAEEVVAIDIGTTTIAAIKIFDGEIVAKASCYNGQSIFGDNVVTRIDYAKSVECRKELQSAVVNSINKLLSELKLGEVKRVAVAGNTVMTSLLFNIDPTPIGVMPFTPETRVFPVVNASELGINCNALLYAIPSISGYVGGDLTAGYYESNLDAGEMIVDIGTNCEMIFNSGNGVYCTAAAAGPAFEGASIECGCRAIAGAIDHYFGKDDYSVIEDIKPIGLCGSAMVDFLAVENEEERLNTFGRFVPSASECAITDTLKINEGDIEQLLKAKAAVYAGIISLESHCNCKVKKIYLAGGFAKFLNLDNAIKINMLVPCEYKIIGNSSLAGAARLACAPSLMAEYERLIDIPQEIVLNTIEDFEDNYIDGLMLQ